MEKINTQRFRQKLKSYRRTPLSLFLFLLVTVSAVITVFVLFLLIAYILIKGIPHLTPELFSWTYNSENVSMLPSIINTILMTLLSLLIATPLGIFSAIYLVEYAKRGNKVVNVIRVTAETLRNAFLCRHLALEPFSFIRGGDIGDHDFTFDYANDGGSAQIGPGYLSGRQFRTGGGKTAYRIPDCTPFGDARYSGRRNFGHWPDCGRNSGPDFYRRYGSQSAGKRI